MTVKKSDEDDAVSSSMRGDVFKGLFNLSSDDLEAIAKKGADLMEKASEEDFKRFSEH